jgi:hypothetical protein
MAVQNIKKDSKSDIFLKKGSTILGSQISKRRKTGRKSTHGMKKDFMFGMFN